jgi:hypothetical protein
VTRDNDLCVCGHVTSETERGNHVERETDRIRVVCVLKPRVGGMRTRKRVNREKCNWTSEI